jgi:hypothetical protein
VSGLKSSSAYIHVFLFTDMNNNLIKSFTKVERGEHKMYLYRCKKRRIKEF